MKHDPDSLDRNLHSSFDAYFKSAANVLRDARRLANENPTLVVLKPRSDTVRNALIGVS